LFLYFSFFFNDTATTEIYTLSLHDALPIFVGAAHLDAHVGWVVERLASHEDRKSTRLNSSHEQISYAVFCLKKKKKHDVVYFFIKKKRNNIRIIIELNDI